MTVVGFGLVICAGCVAVRQLKHPLSVSQCSRTRRVGQKWVDPLKAGQKLQRPILKEKAPRPPLQPWHHCL